MEVENSQIWDRIAHSVLEDDYEEYSQLYHIRLKFLYSMMLEEINETNALDTLEFLIDEIIGYENSQKYMSLISLNDFKNMSPEIAIRVFSSVAFGLAVEQLKGRTYFSVAEFMKESFNALIEDTTIITEGVLSANRILISETLLDLNFVNGEPERMSFRLKRQLDLME